MHGPWIGFDDEHVNLGACLHQGPVRTKEQTPGNPEAADISVMQLLSDEPGTPVLVADIKLNDHKHAIRETSLYAAACVTLRHEDDTCPLILGLPMTTEVSSLQVYVIAHNIMWRIPIASGKSPSFPALLCTVYAAVQHLCSQPITAVAPQRESQPFKSMADYTPLGNDHSFKQNNRVFNS